MQQVTATAGEVVVAKRKKCPTMWCFQWLSGAGHWDMIYETKRNLLDGCIADAIENKQPYRIVRIPGEEVKDGK